MTICVIDGGHCLCQPQEGCFCPAAKTDADRCKVAKAYAEMRAWDGWDDVAAPSVEVGSEQQTASIDSVSASTGEAARRETRLDARDSARLDWLIPVISGEDTGEADARTMAIAACLLRGLEGRAAIDAAMDGS